MDHRLDPSTTDPGRLAAADAEAPLATTADAGRRMISVLRADHKVDRYVLHRYPRGAVAWRRDTFAPANDPTQGERWIAYHGELTLAEVIARLPEHARLLSGWTRDEIERGVNVEGADDFVSQERRERALEQLRAELAGVLGGASRDAA